MTDELEFPAGISKEDIKKGEMEFKKNNLAIALGWTREKFDKELESIKDFFTEQKKTGNKS